MLLQNRDKESISKANGSGMRMKDDKKSNLEGSDYSQSKKSDNEEYGSWYSS
jgi:hypothetical protein